MITKRYLIILFSFLFVLSVYPAQNSSGKLKRTLHSSSNHTSVVNQAGLNNSQLISNVTANLKSFMKKTGVSPSALRVYSSRQNIAPAVSTLINSKLSMPQQTASMNIQGINKIIYDDKFGTPRLIDVKASSLQKGRAIQSLGDAEVQSMNFLKDNKELLKISNPQNEFTIENAKTDEFGITHIRYKQDYQGLEVWGKEIYIHMDQFGNISSLTGRYAATPAPSLNLVESITSSEAISQATNDLKSRVTFSNLSPQLEKLLNYYGPSARKIIWYDKNANPHLAWYVEVRSGLSQDWYYFIDAQNNSILNSYNNVCYDGAAQSSGVDLNGVTRNFGTYQVGSTYYMLDASQPMFNAAQSQLPNNPVGAIESLDLRNTDFSSSSQYYYITSTNNQWNDPTSVSSNYNAITTYNYYLNVQKRNSIDDKGMTIYSLIHATENGQPLENAFWSGTVMCYGDGGQLFKPLAGGLDVAAHEMTHGVTQYTSNLEYQDQSGALNESMSDVFGKLVDTSNWKIGATIVKDFNTFPSGALRDMSSPHNGSNPGDPGWQPAKLSEYVNGTQDNGGVHVNSGIPNYAFYLVASSIGRSSAGRIWYKAETSYLTRSAQFVDARIATEKAATEFFGSSSNELNAVKSAWDNVGVLEGNSTPPPPQSQVVGQNWILATNTDPNDPNSIYMAKTTIQSSADYFALSQTPVLTKPAITDTSGFILFVDKNNNLRGIYANPQKPQETLIDTSEIWESVAIGPGLNSFAITTKYTDTTIYYFDLVDTTKSRAFKIRTPAYDAANTQTALYADAMSFDPTGQYLMFDTFNQIRGSAGDTLSFWNINLLEISTGRMETVFPPLQKGIDVGNPSFSKTSQTRFTFDYVDNNQSKFQVMAADFNSGNSAIVAASTAIGFPSYSGDDKTIVYHTIVNGQDAVQQMPLQSDFITGTGNPVSYLSGATYPVWFVVGSRVTDVKKNHEVIPQSISLEQNYPNPFNPSTTISYSITKTSFVTLKIFDILGREVTTLVNSDMMPGSYNVRFNAAGLASGIYFYQLKTIAPSGGDFISTKKMLLEK